MVDRVVWFHDPMAQRTPLTETIPGRDSAAPRPKSLILDVYGRYASQFDGWLAVSDLVELMGLLNVDEQAVRSAVSRMTRRGLLEREVRSGTRGYAVTATAAEMFAEADHKIYEEIGHAPVSDGWILVSFSMPEDARDKRHALRSHLMWLGLGTVSSGLRIGPRRIHDDVVDVVGRLGLEEYVDLFSAEHLGLGPLVDLAERAWDLPALAGAYRDFLQRFGPLHREVRSRKVIDPADAFATYTITLHEWRKFPYLDPGLPPELLPDDWPGPAAWDLFADLRARLEPTAFDHAASIAARTSASAG